LPGARAQTIRCLARAVCDGKISFSDVVNVQDLITRFREIPGIGDWTAEYVAMRALSEPDAFPASDLGLLRAAGVEKARQLEARAEAWRPWRAYAAMYLWQTIPQTIKKKGVTQNVHLLRDNGQPARAIAASV
jgi:3-methyladenine DNA glycosylase/8-oxoguanine DNA glycosylase